MCLSLCRIYFFCNRWLRFSSLAIRASSSLTICFTSSLMRLQFSCIDAIKGIEDETILPKITIQYNAANSALSREPTGQGMESFIEQFFDTDKIRHYTKKDIFKLRNVIIHGDSMNISNEINDVIEHIGIILILKLLGCPIQVNDVLGYSDIQRTLIIKNACPNLDRHL